MTKNQAKILLLEHFHSDADILLAGFLHISRQAVHKWKPDAPIPLSYQWMLHAIYPDVFPRPELHDFMHAVHRQTPVKQSQTLNN